MRPPKKLGALGLLRRMVMRRNAFFLKCDEKGCLYVAFYEYPHESLVDTPCPNCGANLCTQEDMKAFVDKDKTHL